MRGVRTGAALAVVAVVALLATGCARGDGGAIGADPSPRDPRSPGTTATPTGSVTASPRGTPAERSPGEQNPAPPSQRAAPGGDDEAGQRVRVRLVDYRIDMPTSLRAGTYTFVIEQAGNHPHALAIQGPGVDEESDVIEPGGRSAEMTVTLRPGTYEVWCPVGNHRAMGMELTLQVR